MAHGGKRPGAGRKVGSKVRIKVKQRHKRELSEIARDYTTVALKALVDVAKGGESESARVSAATVLLDRGYGKPKQQIDARVSIDLDALPEEEFNAAYELARRITGRGA